MSFWESVGNFLESSFKTGQKYINEHKEKVYTEMEKLYEKSDESLLHIAKNGSTISKQAASMILKEKGILGN